MSRRLLVLGTAAALVLAAAWYGSGFNRAAPGSLTLLARDGRVTEVSPQTFFRPAGGTVLSIPRTGTLIFPGGDDYRLFSREGEPVSVVFDVNWRLVGTGAAAAWLLRGSDSTFVSAVVEAPLRRHARAIAAGLPMERIAATGGNALREAMDTALRSEADIEFHVSIRSFALTPGATTVPVQPPVLVIGIDALDGRLLDDAIAAGHAPNLAGLIRRGVRGDLATLTPMLSPLIWTSMATGVGPDRHGILDFLTPDPATGGLIPVTSAQRRAPAFWNVATAHGRPVDVVAWLATWPAESITGRLVSDRFGFLAYAAGASGSMPAPDMVFPPSLLEELKGISLAPTDVTFEATRRVLNVDRAAFEHARGHGFEKGELVNNYILTLATAESSTRIGERFLRASGPAGRAAITAVYYEYLDAVGHLFMRFASPRRGDVSADDWKRYGNAVTASYAVMDEYVGRLLAAAGDSTTVLVVSDHGFHSGDGRPTGPSAIEGGQAARWHRNPGVIILAGPGIRRGDRLQKAHVLDVTPTLLYLAGLPLADDLEGNLLAGAIDPGRLASSPATRVPHWSLPPDVWAPPDLAMTPGGPANTTGTGRAATSLDSVKSWVNLGLVLEQRGDLAEAERFYLRALDAAPGDPNATNNLANVWRRSGRVREAITFFERLTAEHPEFRPALQNLGACYLEADQPGKAIEWFNRALAAEPGNILARVNRGHAHLRIGQSDQAEADFR
ncbi:MAG TPA: alkaline phosphatase family protein, partial [Candidatus Eisenbacteria bacterium]